MCAIPDPEPPPDVVASPSAVGKSAAGSVATGDELKKKNQRQGSLLAEAFAPLQGGTPAQTSLSQALAGLTGIRK